ncbi:hypothetical protein ACFU53_10750 [Streptomyces sp. NPDC057474]|uniref:hypothetical protein n=1 Tax=Streptomyces sp. NPDC057474 TaxID=3346144 RepID=UPI0036A7D896
MERLRATLKENDENLTDIVRLSDVSFRQWLDSAARRVAESLGISLAKVEAFLEDVRTIALNAKESFRNAYKREKERARKVKRLGPE